MNTDKKTIQTSQAEDDLLWQHLKSVPAFRALLRSIEARMFQQMQIPEPCLDLGCGDGHFARLAFERPLAVGIDPWLRPLRKANRAGSYNISVRGMGDAMPFPDRYFNSVISNSVLEHIPIIQPVLLEVNRVLNENGLFVFTTPSENFTRFLSGGRWFDNLGFENLAHRYRKFFNRISRHYHTDSPEIWNERLDKADFVVERWQYYFSADALHALEIGHLQGMPSAIIHAITGHWIVAPWEKSLDSTERWIRPLYEEEYPEEGTMMIFVARKKPVE